MFIIILEQIFLSFLCVNSLILWKCIWKLKAEWRETFTFGFNGSKEVQRFQDYPISVLKNLFKKSLKRRGQHVFCLFPNIPITKKPNEIKLGRGKGNVKYWAFCVHPGTPIIGINGHNFRHIIPALKSAQAKLPIKTRIFFRSSWWVF